MMEEGWVLIDKRDELDDDDEAAGHQSMMRQNHRDWEEEEGLSASPASSARRWEHLYRHHLRLSTLGVQHGTAEAGPTCARCLGHRARWLECESYARYLVRFFPSEDVLALRRTAATEERRRAAAEMHHHAGAERAWQRQAAARRQREGEPMRRWMDSILRRWAAADARDGTEPGGDRRDGPAGRRTEEGHSSAGPSDQHSPLHDDGRERPSDGNESQLIAAPEQDRRSMKEDETTKADSSATQEQGQASKECTSNTDEVSTDDQGEERRRLKEEGRKRFREWKKKDGTEVVTSVPFIAPTVKRPTSAQEKARIETPLSRSGELEGWELINAQEANRAEEGVVCTTNTSVSDCVQPNLDATTAAERESEEGEGKPDVAPEGDSYTVPVMPDRSQIHLQQVVKEKMGERNDVRFVPFSYPKDKAFARFDHWRQSLWFAPSGFSGTIEDQHLQAVWMPYYTMRLTMISSFKSRISVAAPTPDADAGSLQQWERTEVREIAVNKESSYDSLLVCASVEETDQKMIKSIGDWNIIRAVQLYGTSSESAENNATTAHEQDDDKFPIIVRDMIGPNDAWKKAEKEIIAHEKEACREQIKNEHSPKKIQQLILTKLTFKGRPTFSIVYVPVFIVTYLHNDKRYGFAVNGQSGRSSGERPYGTADAIDGVGDIFGADDQEHAGILLGQVLRKVDNSPYYKDGSWYLVFPPSHSYLITSATGYITLRNAGDRDIVLSSQPRCGEKVTATCVLESGETETFDYKGTWCLELRYADSDRGQPEIELIEFRTSGGGQNSNRLSMS